MKIKSLVIYPIKSCGGISQERLQLLPSGPLWDRILVLADEDGRFISQRTRPSLSRIRTCMPASSDLSAEVLVAAHGMGSRSIRLFDAAQGKGDPKLCSVIIHKDTCSGIDLGDEHADWFSHFLGKPCRLVQQVFEHPRIREPRTFNRKISVSYADGYPLLVVGESSRVDLNRKIVEAGNAPVPMDRFRPNIVIADALPYAEDGWKYLRIGTVVLEGATKCTRCVITTTDQETGERGVEPLRTLATYRKSAEGIEFGRNFVVVQPGLISVGDAVEIF